MSNKLLFIHDDIPRQGISGNIVFLRHFEKLQSWNIQIFVPEQVVNSQTYLGCKTSWNINSLPNRKFYWPPFRESSSLSINTRLWLWQKSIEKFMLKQGKPQAILTVLWHYYSVVACNISKKFNIPLFVIIHDRWDLRTNLPHIAKQRNTYAQKVLEQATKVWPVTLELGEYFLGKNSSKLQVLLPIPGGYVQKKTLWKPEFANRLTLVYSGTVEKHHYQIFSTIATAMKGSEDCLIIVTNPNNEIGLVLALRFSNIKLLEYFPKNKDAVNFIVNNASAILVTYGFSIEENPFSEHSFPSKMIEFSYTGLPILSIAPVNSAFGKWLEKNQWHLIVTDNNTLVIKESLDLLKQKEAWNKMSSQTWSFSQKKFKVDNIHQIFESGLHGVLNVSK